MNELKKEYTLQGLTFKFRKPTLSYRYDANLLIAQLDLFLEEFTKVERLNLYSLFPKISKLLEGLNNNQLTELISEAEDLTRENKDKDAYKYINEIQEEIFKKAKLYPREALEFFDAYNHYLKKKQSGIEIFFSDIDNAKKLFKTCLVGDIEKINFDISDPDELIEYDDFLNAVINDFFLSKRIHGNLLKK